MSIEAPKRRRWPWVIGGIGAAAVLGIGGVVVYNAGQSNAPAPQPTPPAAAPEPTTEPDEGAGGEYAGRGPNGCAGGETVDANMVLTAQAEASQDTDGATEVAAAFTRWLVREPLPSVDEAAQLQDQIMADDAAIADLAEYVSTGPDLLESTSGDARTTTLGGVWQVESSSPDAVTVTLGNRVVEDGAVDPNSGLSMTVDVVWQDGAWKIVRGEHRIDVNVLFQNGIEFDEGC